MIVDDEARSRYCAEDLAHGSSRWADLAGAAGVDFYRNLASKPVALEAATGFSFASPVVLWPRSVCPRLGSGDQPAAAVPERARNPRKQRTPRGVRLPFRPHGS